MAFTINDSARTSGRSRCARKARASRVSRVSKKSFALKLFVCVLFCLVPTFAFAKTSAEEKKAQEALQKAESSLAKGYEEFLDGKWMQAQANLQVALNNGMETDEIYYMLLLCHMNLKSYDKANSTCDIFLQKYEDSPLAEYVYYQKGLCLYKQNRLDFAAEAFSTCCLYYPNGSLYLQSFFYAGECFYNMGKSDDAKVVYTAIVAEFPTTDEGKESIKRLQSIQNKTIPVWKDPQIGDALDTTKSLLELKSRAAQVELLLMEIEGK